MGKAKKSRASVMFVCTGNTCRSPMMEYIFKAYAKSINASVAVASSGLLANEGRPMNDNAKTVLRSMNIRFAHKSQPFGIDMVDKYTLIVCATNDHAKWIGNAPNVLAFAAITGGKDLDDPYGKSVEAYKKTAEYISFACEDIYNKLMELYGAKEEK